MNPEAIVTRIQSQLGSTSTPSRVDLAHPPPRVPDHELIARIGGGSYGEVWLARSITGGLHAVKVVWRSNFSSDRPYEREFKGIVQFEPISRSHPGVVNILHVGRDDAARCFYYVMELADSASGPGVSVPGSGETPTPDARTQTPIPLGYSPRTLASDLRARGRIPVADAVMLGVQLANALGHLHRHGLVHRDVKPSNVIFVGGQPKLADIGLVTGVDEARSFVGTEGFIPPEGPGSEQADIFSLGRLLYEAATGKDRSEFPMLPTDLDHWPQPEREVMLELNEVLARACAPKPKQRHANAAELAADLNVILAGRSVRRAYGLERRLRQVTRVSLAAVAVLALSAGVFWFQETERRQSEIRATREASLRQRAEAAEREQSRLRDEAEKAQANEALGRRRAEAQELAARKKAYASDMRVLQHSLAVDDLGRAQDLLNRQRPQPGEQDLRGWEWRYLWQFCKSDAAFTVAQRPSSILSVSFSSDGGLLGVGGFDQGDVAVVRLSLPPSASQGPLLRTSRNLSFMPSGDVMAYYVVSNRQYSIVLSDVRTRTVTQRLPINAPLRNLAFTLDGRLFVADASNSNNITVWDVARGDLLKNFTARLPAYINSPGFAITVDGSRFAHVMQTPSGFVRIMNENGAPNEPFRVTEEFVTAMAFSPDGQTLVTGGGYSEGTIKLWKVQTRQLIGSLEGHRSYVSFLKFLPDGKTLASSSADRTIRLWDFEARRTVRTLRGQGSEIWTFDVSPDGRWLASGGKDGAVLMWDLDSSTSRPPLHRTLAGRTGSWGYSPDGRWLPAIQERRLKLYDAATLQLAGEPALTLTNITGFAFSPDMRLLMVTDLLGNLGGWDLTEQRMVTNFVAHPTTATAATAFASDGRSFVTHGLEGVFKEWDAATWQERHRVLVLTNLISWSYCPAENLVATTRGRGYALIPLHDPSKIRRFTGEARIISLDLSPDGKTFAAASENGTVEIWDTETLVRRALLGGVLLGYHSVAFSPNGQRLAAGSSGLEAIKLWDLPSHEEVATLSGQGSLFTGAKFSSDGNTLGARNLNGVLHLWTAPGWKEIETAETAQKARATVGPNSNPPQLPQ